MNYSTLVIWATSFGYVFSHGIVLPAGALTWQQDEKEPYHGQADDGGPKEIEQNSVRHLERVPLHTSLRIRGKIFGLSHNAFRFHPAADSMASVDHEGGGILLHGTDDYLIARYGSAATVVCYVGGWAGSGNLPATYLAERGHSHDPHLAKAEPVGPKNGFKSSPGSSVPDGGSTLAFLGMGITSLGLVHRQLRRSRIPKRK